MTTQKNDWEKEFDSLVFGELYEKFQDPDKGIPYKEIKSFICSLLSRQEKLVELSRDEVLKFLCLFFQPEITGNEKKCFRLADEIVAKFGVAPKKKMSILKSAIYIQRNVKKEDILPKDSVDVLSLKTCIRIAKAIAKAYEEGKLDES